MAKGMQSHRGRRGPSSRSGAIKEDLCLCDDEKRLKRENYICFVLSWVSTYMTRVRVRDMGKEKYD